MGNTKNSAGKRVFDDVYSFPQDSQDNADDIFEYANARVGSSVARQAFPVAQRRTGMLWTETDAPYARYRCEGTTWVLDYRPLATYDPAPTGLTVGGATITAMYEQRGRLVQGFIEIIAGGSTAATANLAFQMPVTPAGPTVYRHIGDGLIRLAAGNSWPIQARMAGSALINAAAINVNGGAGTQVVPGALVSNTFPTGGAWGSGASLYLSFMYLAV